MYDVRVGYRGHRVFMGSVYLRSEDQLTQETVYRGRNVSLGLAGRGVGSYALHALSNLPPLPTTGWPPVAVLPVGLCSRLSFAFSFKTELSPWELVRRALAGGGATRTFLIFYGWLIPPPPHIPGNLSLKLARHCSCLLFPHYLLLHYQSPRVLLV